MKATLLTVMLALALYAPAQTPQTTNSPLCWDGCPVITGHTLTPTCNPNWWTLTVTWTTKEDRGEDRIKIKVSQSQSFCVNATHSGSITVGPFYTTNPSAITLQPFLGNDCYGDPCTIIGLPVTLESFNAVRSNATVRLDWKTASEQDNKGFTVQRTTDGRWHDIAFVASTADQGTSSTPIVYTYTDQYPLAAVSQYRLLQTDHNGRITYSQVRVVQGDRFVPTKLFNANGIVTIVFSDNTKHNVSLADAQGRVVQTLHAATGVTVLKKVMSGFYTVTIATNGNTTTEKIVVE